MRTFHKAAFILIAWTALILGVVFLGGCGHLSSKAIGQQAAINQTTQSISSHADAATDHTTNAIKAVTAATDAAKAIPDAAPVLPPLSTASDELKAVKDEVKAIHDQVGSLASQVNTLSGTVTNLTTANDTLTTQNVALKKQWNESWLGGKSWFWIHTIEITLGLLFVGLFVAEFFFGLNIHPLTWIFEAVPFIAKGAVNFVTATIGEIKSLVTYIIGRFKPAPTPTVPPPNPVK